MKIVRRTCGTTSSRFQRSTRSFVPWHLQLEFLVLWELVRCLVGVIPRWSLMAPVRLLLPPNLRWWGALWGASRSVGIRSSRQDLVQDCQNSKNRRGIYRTYGKLKERGFTDFSCWWTVSWKKQIENPMTPRNDKKTILSFWDGSFSGANLLLNCLIAEGDVFVFTDSIYCGRSSPFLFHHHLAPTIVINGVVNGRIKWVSGVITPISLGEYLWNFFPSALTRVANLSP